MIKSDNWIKQQSGMITPFEPELVREVDGQKRLSSGPSSYGYDLRLGSNFYLFISVHGLVGNPKDFDDRVAQLCYPHVDSDGEFFIMPAHSFALGVTMERVVMPENCTGLLLNKSTYARCGITMPATVIEAGFAGYITLELSNNTPIPWRVYEGEGIAQLVIFEGEDCITSYSSRDGKYQNQPNHVVYARV